MRVLVIKLGALGDFVQAFGPFAAIREHHSTARIALLTTPPFADLARRSPWFDEIRIDRRPAVWNLPGLIALVRRLRGFDIVYDLQTSTRSSRYFPLAGKPAWSGIARGASLPHSNPQRDLMHTRERQREQLEMATISAQPAPDLSWLTATPIAFDLPRNFALLVPGAAPHRPAKRWPAQHFARLASELDRRGLTPVIIGTEAESPIARQIRAACANAVDLTGRTGIAEIAAIAAKAMLAVGNDTGPMHLAAAVGCPCIVLFSADSDPALTSPRGPGGVWPTILREDDLADLPPSRVLDRVADVLAWA